MITEPLERLRAATRRIRELALHRTETGLTHQDSDDDVGTIGTDGALGYDPFPLLEALDRSGVRVAVVGQVAGIMHGSTELTGDLDLLWDGSPDHAPALAAAFAAAGARFLDDGGWSVAPEALLRPKAPFTSPVVGGDCCTPELAWGGLQVRDILGRALTAVDASGLRVHYVRRDDLVLMRRALGRPKDLRRADELDRS
ncbi:hypothetical protein [Nonomuraea longicatena]|uniref:Nucleotidyltransferase family protein n=1 Tax=Nonomuraea longicatena TaxID=83682 RepID=A0ABN1NV38_9ACTN